MTTSQTTPKTTSPTIPDNATALEALRGCVDKLDHFILNSSLNTVEGRSDDQYAMLMGFRSAIGTVRDIANDFERQIDPAHKFEEKLKKARIVAAELGLPAGFVLAQYDEDTIVVVCESPHIFDPEIVSCQRYTYCPGCLSCTDEDKFDDMIAEEAPRHLIISIDANEKYGVRGFTLFQYELQLITEMDSHIAVPRGLRYAYLGEQKVLVAPETDVSGETLAFHTGAISCSTNDTADTPFYEMIEPTVCAYDLSAHPPVHSIDAEEPGESSFVQRIKALKSEEGAEEDKSGTEVPATTSPAQLTEAEFKALHGNALVFAKKLGLQGGLYIAEHEHYGRVIASPLEHQISGESKIFALYDSSDTEGSYPECEPFGADHYFVETLSLTPLHRSDFCSDENTDENTVPDHNTVLPQGMTLQWGPANSYDHDFTASVVRAPHNSHDNGSCHIFYADTSAEYGASVHTCSPWGIQIIRKN